MLDDALIRGALLERLRSRWATSTDTLLVEEFGTHFGAARIDLAAVNGHLWGYEIKSAADRLNRLPSQIAAYGEVFDYVTLVVADRHLQKASSLIPDWWAVMRAVDTRSRVRLVEHRRGRHNPRVSAGAVARLLWRDELAAILEALGADSGVRSATRDVLADRLVASVPAKELGVLVRDQIRARPRWRADPARTPDAGTFQRAHTSSGFLARRVQPPRR